MIHPHFDGIEDTDELAGWARWLLEAAGRLPEQRQEIATTLTTVANRALMEVAARQRAALSDENLRTLSVYTQAQRDQGSLWWSDTARACWNILLTALTDEGTGRVRAIGRARRELAGPVTAALVAGLAPQPKPGRAVLIPDEASPGEERSRGAQEP